MDPTSGNPTLPLPDSALDEDTTLDEFFFDIIEKDDPCENFDIKNFDLTSSFLVDNHPIENGISIEPDSGTGSLSPNGSSTLSMSPHSTSQYLDSPTQGYIEIKPQPAEVILETKNSLSSTKRRISDRLKPSLKAQKKPRIEKNEQINPKLEILEDKLAQSSAAITVTPSNEIMTTSSSNEILLTSEEQDVLAQNNWEPTEKNLKKARRKIKNKISAQESRRRKRDYVSNLEDRLQNFSAENNQLKKELEKEQADKKSLLCQLRELQQVVNQRFQGKNVKTATTQTSAAVMVVLLCMTIFKGSWTQEEEDSILHNQVGEEFDYTTPSYKSRLLKCFSEDDMDFCNVDGKNLPVYNFDEEDEDPVHLLEMQMTKMDVRDKASYKPGTLVNIAQSVLNKNLETNASEVQL